jgi:hypothetical protein
VGSFVIYRAHLGHHVRGKVTQNGGNGRLYVQPWFEQRAGQDTGGFIGGEGMLVLTTSLVED